MISKNKLTKVFFSVFWIPLTISASYILSKYIFPDVTEEKKLFGIYKEKIIQFNLSLFLLINLISLFVLLIINFIYEPTVKKIELAKFETIFSNRILLTIITALAVCLYILGLIKPLYVSEKFYLWNNEVTLWQTVELLFEYREIFLGVIILLFTIILPITKFIFIFIALWLIKPDFSKQVIKLIKNISKWSMLDVFIVAILLFNLKFDSKIIDMELKSGIIFFSLSIIISIFILNRINYISKKSNDKIT